MKTTLDIADPVLRRAKRLASARGTTLKAIVEQGLRLVLEQERIAKAPKAVPTVVFTGKGLQEGLSWADWAEIQNTSYEGRGG